MPKPRNRQAFLSQSHPEIRVFYTECLPVSSPPKGTILLIHGFPETSYQFRNVIGPLASAGYHVVAPDYRGAGYSSKPPTGYTKAILAQDLYELVREMSRASPGECPLPGTQFYEDAKHTPPLWHFDFHAQTDMAVNLVTGREKSCIKHFYDRLAQNPAAFTNEDVEFYAMQYSAPGALDAAFTTYRMFEEDAQQNRKWKAENGKVRVRAMVLSGEHGFMTAKAEEMAAEYYEKLERGIVEGAGHWLAEENPEGFIREVLRFIEEK
ncbi:hypothetical protein MMC13_001141 [Lambiella insularis]|nr:hypothetical protein [Lambiella insularis]